MSAWVEYIKPFYPEGKRGRPPKNIETMLRMYLLQNGFTLSGEGAEYAIYDRYAMKYFYEYRFYDQTST